MQINLNNCFDAKRTLAAPIPGMRNQWNGNMDDAETLRPGGFLLASLISHAKANSMQLKDMARELGVGYGYINQLRNGIRRIDQISDDLSLGMAHFLGIPRLIVLMLAGIIAPDDIFESKIVVAAEISRAISFMCSDPAWGHLVTPELRKADEASQFLLVKMFEAATGKVLLNSELNHNNLRKYIREHEVVIAEWDEA
jgi:transcriptional regulator with XRE-family HTH domain